MKYFIPGLGEKPKEYKRLSKHLNIVNVDWNTGKHSKIKTPKLLVSFSLGILIAERYKTDTLILCSPTPGFESLSNVKAKKVIFIIGDTEKWVIKDARRVAKTLKCPYTFHIVKGKHKVEKDYQKLLLSLV